MFLAKMISHIFCMASRKFLINRTYCLRYLDQNILTLMGTFTAELQL
jgi:hypothetical protein